ncbi:MAG: hypothetical protein KF774_09050 [Planctomyces sp.]|nr:hypothetical protein [Planctomyces sp.]
MRTPSSKIILTREIDGRVERVEWIRHADTVWIVRDNEESILGPDAWQQAWADLQALGFVEIFPADQRKIAAEKIRLLGLVRRAFQGVALGEGRGLREADGLDDYADARTLAAYRAQDEKRDWSAIPAADLNRHCCGLSFFDAEGMRFHLPAYLIAELEDQLDTASIVFHLTCMAGGTDSRFDALSAAQRDAVRQFLLMVLSDPHQKFEHPMIEESLRTRWTAFTSTAS